jgi:hypothetical protein
MKKHITKTHFAAINGTNDIAVLPTVKKPALLLHYKSIIEDDGNVKEFTIKSKPIL